MTPRVARGSRAGTSSVASDRDPPVHVAEKSGRSWRRNRPDLEIGCGDGVAIAPSRRPWAVAVIRASGSFTSPLSAVSSSATSAVPASERPAADGQALAEHPTRAR